MQCLSNEKRQPFKVNFKPNNIMAITGSGCGKSCFYSGMKILMPVLVLVMWHEWLNFRAFVTGSIVYSLFSRCRSCHFIPVCGA